jgi:hypothetical protein
MANVLCSVTVGGKERDPNSPSGYHQFAVQLFQSCCSDSGHSLSNIYLAARKFNFQRREKSLDLQDATAKSHECNWKRKRQFSLAKSLCKQWKRISPPPPPPHLLRRLPLPPLVRQESKEKVSNS